uniref:Extended synaptotagmin-like protein 2a n=1 Tax=Neogobius melanostomus TaxID=47308 RepID=A0A8C6WVL7_9GOBI
MDSAMNGPNSRPNGPIPPAAYGPDALPDPQDLEDDPMSSLTAVSQMWMKFGKTFLVILPIYILGYFEFSFSWILVGLAAMFYWKRNYSTQDNHINRALRFLDHEEKVTKRNAATSQLPPWVSHFYRTVKQMWPFISQFVEKLFRDTIEPAVKNATPYLSSFCFTKIDLGDKPLRVNGVKVYTENVDKRQVIMDLEVSFVGNTEIDIDIKKFYCRAGIKNIQWLDINWTGLTNMLDIPGVNGLTDNLILDILCQHLVMPNKIKIPLVGDDQLAQLRFPVPKGVLRIHFLEAQDLLGKDKFLGGLIKGKSDPYGVLEVGTQLFKSKVINDTVNPKWNEVYEALIYDNSSWFDLEDVSQGKLHLKLEWLSLLPKPDKLDQVLSDIKAGQSKANDGLSSALLVVFLDSARNLPVSPSSPFRPPPSGKKVTSDPSPFVQFRMGHKHFESKVRYKTNEPVWEEAFTFLVHNPRSQELEVEVRCDKQECSLGNLTVPLQSLLEAKDMTLEKHFALRTTGPTSTLKMKMALWILSVDKDSGSDPAPSSVPISKSSSSSTPRPSISSDSALKTSSVSDTQDQTPRTPGAVSNGGDVFGMGLSQSNLNIAGSQLHLPGGKEPTPSIASDISNPLAEQELWNRVSQLHNGSSPFPLGEIQLTIRHSSQRNKLIVVVHSCRNLSAFTDHGSDPYVRLYLLPDKRRSGRRKTSTFKKNLNPVYDQTFEFSVSVVELHRRTLDVAVKNGGGLLSKHRGLLGKVI